MDGIVREREPVSQEADEHAWLLQQAQALRAGRLSGLDTDNLAEFLEYMAGRDRREVGSRLRLLLMHLLKFRVQPDLAGRSWALTVLREQNNLNDLLESASLRRIAEERWALDWERVRKETATETSLPLKSIPAKSPWTLDEALRWKPPAGLATLRARPKKK